MSGVRVVKAEGDAIARGRTIGRELGDLIDRSLAFYKRYFDRRGISSSQLVELLTPFLAAAEARSFESLRTLNGMAEGATVPFFELFAVNAFEELEPLLTSMEGEPSFLDSKEGRGPHVERCSSFSAIGPTTTLLGHNEQWLAGDVGNVAVVIELPEDRMAAIASPTIACCLPAVGMNARGGAQGIQSLTASDDGEGIPRVLLSRNTLHAVNREDAIRRATIEGRAGGYGHVFAFKGGDSFLFETSAHSSAG